MSDASCFFAISLITAAQLCSDACDYRQDGSCDDGGPNAEYKGCRLGSDCMDCGVRNADIYSEKAKFHRLGRFGTLYKLQQKYVSSDIDHELRAMEKPSDHCPVFLELNLNLKN